MQFKTTLAVALISVSLLGLTACQESEQDVIKDAQYCMDDARTSSQAQACISKLEGIETPAAYVIRCAGEFISQGFTSPSRLVDVIDALKADGGTAGLLGFMSFTDLTSANRAFTSCTKSNQKGMNLLAALMRTATTITSTDSSIIAGLTANPPVYPTEQQVKDAIDNVLTAGNEEVIGETIKTVYQVSCGSGSPANADVCNQINDAAASYGGISSASAADIGAYLLNEWKNGQ